jgi:hypothetical protein
MSKRKPLTLSGLDRKHSNGGFNMGLCDNGELIAVLDKGVPAMFADIIEHLEVTAEDCQDIAYAVGRAQEIGNELRRRLGIEPRSGQQMDHGIKMRFEGEDDMAQDDDGMPF